MRLWRREFPAKWSPQLEWGCCCHGGSRASLWPSPKGQVQHPPHRLSVPQPADLAAPWMELRLQDFLGQGIALCWEVSFTREVSATARDQGLKSAEDWQNIKHIICWGDGGTISPG